MFIRTPRSVQFYAIALVLILVVPLVAVTAGLLIRSANLEKGELHSRLLQVTAAVADDIDREIDRRIAILETLATSTHLQSGHWKEFHEQSAAAMKARSYIILVDMEGRQVVNTYVPFGDAPTLTGDPKTIAAIAKTKSPVVSNLFRSRVVGRPVINVSIPVLEDGSPKYVLSIAVFPENIREILTGQSMPPTWIMAVWDRDDVLIARSVDSDGPVGMRFPRQLDDQARKSTSVRSGTNLSGQPVLVAATTSRLSGWRVSVNVPEALAEDAMMRTFRWFGFASFLALCLGLSASFLFAQRLQAALDAIATAIGSLKERKALPRPPETLVVQANAVISALGDAASALISHEQRQKILLAEVTHRTKNLLTVIQAMAARTFSEADRQAAQTFTERLHALGRAQDLLIQSDWKGMPLRDLLAAELFSHLAQVSLRGPTCIIKPSFVQTFSLIVHELCTNAIKHGALTVPTGRILIKWELGAEHERFRLTWTEANGPPVSQPVHRGFGSTLLHMPSTLAETAVVQVNYLPEGLVYVMDLPAADVVVGTDKGQLVVEGA